jgi:hypothetical protein
MRRLIVAAAFFISLATIAFVVVYEVWPGRHSLELGVYVLVVGGLAVLTAIVATRQAFPLAEGSALFEALEREPAAPLRPPDLERTERLLTLAVTTSFDLHYRLRPVLREVAAQRLGDRHGLRLDAGGPRVEQALGDELWELVRPGREAPERRFLPGAKPEMLRRAIERLESLE